MVRCTVEKRVFLYESYVKCASARKCRRKFRRKFPGITVPNTTGIRELINRVRSTGSLLDKKHANKDRVLTEEELDKIWGRLEDTEHTCETPCTRDRHLEIFSSQSDF
jgi:hypothetical protein